MVSALLAKAAVASSKRWTVECICFCWNQTMYHCSAVQDIACGHGTISLNLQLWWLLHLHFRLNSVVSFLTEVKWLCELNAWCISCTLTHKHTYAHKTEVHSVDWIKNFAGPKYCYSTVYWLIFDFFFFFNTFPLPCAKSLSAVFQLVSWLLWHLLKRLGGRRE